MNQIKKCLWLFTFCIAASISQSQGLEDISESHAVFNAETEFDDGTGITISRLTATQINNLAVLAKVWGFLKYHHPRLVAGELNWDYELFRILPDLLDATDEIERNNLLSDWVHQLGTLEPCGPCIEPAEDAHLRPRLAWIHDKQLLGSEISRYLERVYERRFFGTGQFYMDSRGGGANGSTANESDYAGLSEIDVGFRLLALFRYWNIIEYWFPYYDVIGEPWEDVLPEFIPRFVDSSNLDAYALELRALIARIHDTHAGLWSAPDLPPFGECALPFAARFIESQMTVAASSNDIAGPESGIEIGDTIQLIEGRPVADLVAEWSPYYPASNTAALLRLVGVRMARGPCGVTSLTIRRGDRAAQISTERIPMKDISFENIASHDRRGETFQMLSEDVAYLKLSSVKAADVVRYIEASQGAKGLIVDIRNYPAESVVFELGQRLVLEAAPFALFAFRDLNNPGSFVWRSEWFTLRPTKPNYVGRVVVLVDEVTQSHAEFTAMAMQAGVNTIVIGSTTAGADGDIFYIPMPGGMRTAISGAGVFYPDKSPTQRIGIVPDIFVEPTVAGIRQRRDEVLERAIEEILGSGIEKSVIRGIANHSSK